MDPFTIIRQDGLLPKVTIKKAEEVTPLLDAVCKGGIRALEAAPDTDCIPDVLRAAHAHPGTVMGIGTVTTQAMADAFMDAGAGFLTVTGRDLILLEHCLEKGYPVIPVCSSFSEASAAYIKGCRVLKLTPAARPEGLIDILNMSGQLPDASFIPDEGIAPEDLGPWLEEECVAACSGSFIIDSDDIDSGRFSDITLQCEQAVKRVLGFELAHIGINNADRAEAGERAKQVADLFRLPVRPGANSTYAGDALEFMHAGVYGTVGHLGFCTGSAERAMAFFGKRGIDIIGESIRRDERGRVWFFYLREELFGFALHVMNRKRP